MFQCTSPGHVGKWNALSPLLSLQYSPTLLRASRWVLSFEVDRFDKLTNSGSNNDPSVQPAAEILHRERGKSDVPPSLQLYQVDGVHQRQIDLSTKNKTNIKSQISNNNQTHFSDMSNRWLSIRVEFLGNFIVFFAAVFAFYLRCNFSLENETLW